MSKAAATEAALEVAKGELAAAKAVWEGILSQAEAIKKELSLVVDATTTSVQSEDFKPFEENPGFFEAAWDAVKETINKYADDLTILSDLLQQVGSLVAIIPGMQGLGVAMMGAGVLIKGLLFLAGDVSFGEFAFDAVSSFPGAGPLKGAKSLSKAEKFAKGDKGRVPTSEGKSPSSAKADAKKKVDDKASEANGGKQESDAAYRENTRGEQRCEGAEPVDMATGAMVFADTDIYIDGTLPLVVDRNSNSAHELGRALGPRWVSQMDCRIEVCRDEVLMVSPDGALLSFPSAPLDGSEVRCDGRPWMLSFVDGAYRVRNVARGLTWVFSVVSDTASVCASMVEASDPGKAANGGAENTTAKHSKQDHNSDELDAEVMPLVGSIPDGSLGDAADLGFEVGLSAVVHRTGHVIEYDYEPSSGHMVAMRRSDGTRLDLVWDRSLDRVVSAWVSSTEYPDSEPSRLITYEYDAAGRLVRVINSAAGALSYHYDDQGRPCGWTDRNGASYYYRFDEQGRVVTQVGTGGMFANALIYLPDLAADAPVGGRVCVLVETAGEFAADPLEIGDGVVEERLAQVEALPLVTALRTGGLATAGLTGCGRDGARDIPAGVVPEGWFHDEVLGDIRASVYRSDLAGDVWRIISPAGVATDYAYDTEHNVIATTFPDGGVSETVFDDDGLVTGQVNPDGSVMEVLPGVWGAPVKLVGVDGLVTECEVDAQGNVTSVVHPDGTRESYAYEWSPSGSVLNVVVGTDGFTTDVECDPAGRVMALTDAAGRRSSVERDVCGRVVNQLDPVGLETRVEYSLEGWPVRITQPGGGVTTLSYDGEGNLLESVNPVGAVTRNRFTVFDKLVESVDATGAVTRLVYNTQMEVVGVINADGREWLFERDLDGRVVSQRDYNDFVTTSSVDVAAGVTTVVSPSGEVATTSVDVMGRVVEARDAAGVTSFSYDEHGWLKHVVAPGAQSYFPRDEFGRVTGEHTLLDSGEAFEGAYHPDY